MSKASESQPGSEHVLEIVNDKIEHVGKTHPRLRAAWGHSWPFVRIGLFGAAFVGGGILLARWFGPKTARRLGESGGEGFAEGVAKVQNEIAALGRGTRWG